MKVCACGCNRVLPNERFSYLPYHKNRGEPKPEPVPVDPTFQNCQCCGVPDELTEGYCHRCYSQLKRVSTARSKWFEIPVPEPELPEPERPDDEEDEPEILA